MSYPVNPLESPWKYDGTYQARHLALLDLIRIAAGGGGAGGGATEATLLQVLAELQGTLDVNTGLDLSGLSSEATLELVRLLLVSLDGKDYSTATKQDVAKAVLDLIKSNTDNLDVALSTRATEATLEAARLLLVSLDGKDYATETTLALIKPVLDLIKTNSDNLDTPLSTRATETTLAQVKTGIDNLVVNTGAAPNLDAFERLRVSNPTSVFGAQLTYGLQPLVYEPITTGAGATITHDATNRAALLSFSGTTVGGTTIFQSFEHIRYQEGKSQQILLSFNFKESVAGVRKFVGYSDGVNGIEFTSIGGVNSLRILSSSSEGNEEVLQANWNINTFAGLDLSKTQLLLIDFQALYVGKVRIGFEIDGMLIYCHEFQHANLVDNPYIATANLPIRAGQIVESGTATTTMNFICCNVSSEGGVDDPYGVPNNINASVTAANNNRTHLLSVRPRLLYNGFTTRSKIIETEIEITVTGNSPVFWEMCIGQAISGTTTFNNVNTAHSTMEFNTAGTISGTPTLVIDRGYVPATNQNKGSQSRVVSVKVPITLDAAGAHRLNGTISVVVTGVSGKSLTYGVLKWIEIY